jgi:hypothetical protein
VETPRRSRTRCGISLGCFKRCGRRARARKTSSSWAISTW